MSSQARAVRATSLILSALAGLAGLPLAGCDLILGIDEPRSLAPCNTGELRCAGNTPQVCGQDLTWSDLEECSDDAPACSSGKCVGVLSIAAGNAHTCAVLSDDTARCWGKNDNGQLGNGTENRSSTVPAPVVGLTTVTAIALGGDDNIGHTCALLQDQTVACWGANGNGQVNGTLGSNVTTPVTVPGLAHVKELTLGDRHSCALMEDGSVTCWGFVYGLPAEPSKVAGISQAIALDAGLTHTCALVEGGSVVCWGSNKSGQCGQLFDASSPDNIVDVPTTVPGVMGARAIAAGYNHTCAILDDNTAVCWGQNECGQLGQGFACGPKCEQGTTQGCGDPIPKPLAITEPITVLQLALGAYHGCLQAHESTNRVYCWGRDDFLQVGSTLGAVSDHGKTLVPFPVATFVNHARAISAGSYHTCALTDLGPVRCWGRNDFGQLGNGDTQTSSAVAVRWDP